MDGLLRILRQLNDSGVECILVGDMAAVAHGSPAIITSEMSVCVDFDGDKVGKIIAALRPLHPRLRHRPDLPPLPEDAAQLGGAKSLYLVTDLGPVNLLGEVPGIGGFAALKGKTVTMELGGFAFRVLDLDTLIASKLAVSCEKERLALPHLEAIRETTQKKPGA